MSMFNAPNVAAAVKRTIAAAQPVPISPTPTTTPSPKKVLPLGGNEWIAMPWHGGGRHHDGLQTCMERRWLAFTSKGRPRQVKASGPGR